MGVQAGTNPQPEQPLPAAEQPPPAVFKRLLPSGEPATAREIVDALDLQARAVGEARRPYVILNMASTVDGRASLGGRSGPISDQADRELFHGLRSAVDAVMAGAGTVRVERYGRIIASEAGRGCDASGGSARSRSPASSPGACRCMPTCRCSTSRRRAW